MQSEHNMGTRSRVGRLGSVRRILAGGAFAAIASGVAATPLAAAPFRAPPIIAPASAERHPGKPDFAELITPDLATAKKFYAGLFGWNFTDVAGGRVPYAEAYLDGVPVAGLVEKTMAAGEHGQPAWLNFFAAADVDAAAKAALQNGGKVLVAPHDVADRGREAILTDADGAVFAVLASSSGDPADVLAAPGEWIWRSLITTDPVGDSNFYKDVFGYGVVPLADSPGEQHLLLASENFARASVNSMPPGHPNMHPHWLAYVRCEDVTKAVAKVTALGGRILVEPRVDRHGGLIAVVADPLGAPFGLMEWSESQSNQVTK
jgi:predicted enzyme related to lactoylglutathione lyase